MLKKKLCQGIDCFDFNSLSGLNTALISNHTSIDTDGRNIFEHLENAEISVLKIFSPEHGYFPIAQDMESVEETPSIRGIPVISLYGNSYESLNPESSMLENVDVVIYDVQDVGSRYYTYLSTLFIFMAELEKHKIPLIVLDRVNPLNGTDVEGAVLEKRYQSFVGMAPFVQRHGLTSGEAANFYYKEQGFSFPIHIEKLRNWNRKDFFCDYSIPWIPLSPNMPSFETATIYPGGCLIEGTELSEGRGTTFPFHVTGHPNINPFSLSKRMKKYNLPGVVFMPLEFRPMFQKHAMKRCGGVFMSITDRRKFRPLRTFLLIVSECMDMLGKRDFFRNKPYEFVKDIPAIDLLLGNSRLISMFYSGAPFKEMDSFLLEEEKRYLKNRAAYLLYK